MELEDLIDWQVGLITEVDPNQTLKVVSGIDIKGGIVDLTFGGGFESAKRAQRGLTGTQTVSIWGARTGQRRSSSDTYSHGCN